jgi:hypothetical protein
MNANKFLCNGRRNVFMHYVVCIMLYALRWYALRIFRINLLAPEFYI